MFSREDVVKLLLQKKGVDPFSTGGVSVVKERSKVSFPEGRKYFESCLNRNIPEFIETNPLVTPQKYLFIR